MSKRGHSNVHAGQTTTYPTNPDRALIPIEGGVSVSTVKELPPLALSREEWKTIGEYMDWFISPPGTNGGTLWVEFHDRGGRVAVNNLTEDGIHDAKYQCEQMLEELETVQEQFDAQTAEELEEASK